MHLPDVRCWSQCHYPTQWCKRQEHGTQAAAKVHGSWTFASSVRHFGPQRCLQPYSGGAVCNPPQAGRIGALQRGAAAEPHALCSPSSARGERAATGGALGTAHATKAGGGSAPAVALVPQAAGLASASAAAVSQGSCLGRLRTTSLSSQQGFLGDPSGNGAGYAQVKPRASRLQPLCLCWSLGAGVDMHASSGYVGK